MSFFAVPLGEQKLVTILCTYLKWTVDSGQWTVDSGQWTVDSGQWTVDSGQWTVDSGQWTVDSGQWTDTHTTAVRDVLEWFVANQPLKILPGGNRPLNKCGTTLMSFYFCLLLP